MIRRQLLSFPRLFINKRHTFSFVFCVQLREVCDVRDKKPIEFPFYLYACYPHFITRDCSGHQSAYPVYSFTCFLFYLFCLAALQVFFYSFFHLLNFFFLSVLSFLPSSFFVFFSREFPLRNRSSPPSLFCFFSLLLPINNQNLFDSLIFYLSSFLFTGRFNLKTCANSFRSQK